MLQGSPMFRGSLVAIVTPMQANGSLDLDALKSLLDFHVNAGTDGIVIVGTTGESPTVDFDEHCLLIETTVKHVNKRIPVIAGTGANSTREAVTLTAAAKKLGVDACLLVAPYYNKPTQEGLYQHFKTIAESVDIPQILYNVPGRTGCDIHNDTALKLAEISNIIGIKDATGNIERGTDLINRASSINKTTGNFSIYSGDDGTAAALMLMGGTGVISVTANVAPKLMHDMCVAALANDVIQTRRINAKLAGLHKHLFIEANPIPVKWVLATMGLINHGIRLPLVTLSAQYEPLLLSAMHSANINK